MSTFNLGFTLDAPAGPAKLRAAIDALVQAYPDLPSLFQTQVLPGKAPDGETVLIPLPMSLSEQRQAEFRSKLDSSLASNGLRRKMPQKK
jgi:hypothetical protein